MGASASVQSTNQEENSRPKTTANFVRERLRNEFGTSSEVEEGYEEVDGQKQSRNLHEMSTLLKAKGVFMKHLGRQEEMKDTRIVKKQVKPHMSSLK